MDRISAIRNIEDAIRSFEDGERDLAETERQVASILRMYATEFDGEGDVFRAVGDPPADGTVVVAPSKPAARERVRERLEAGHGETGTEKVGAEGVDDGDEDLTFDVERV